MKTHQNIDRRSLAMHRLFLDTEFTNLTQPELISVGLVADNGREFYAERNDFDLAQCSQFVKSIVLPKLGMWPAVTGTKTDISTALWDWLQEFGPAIEICSDHIIDWLLFENLLSPFVPESNVKLIWVDISRSIRDLDIEKYWMENGCDDHHSLHDARANRFAFCLKNTSIK